jgi:ABC-type glycerol-3-phosphate transport system permease component
VGPASRPSAVEQKRRWDVRVTLDSSDAIAYTTRLASTQMRPASPPLIVSLPKPPTFFFQYHVQWPYYFAGLSTAIIPIVVVYLVLQRQFISGMTAGAVRG